MALTVMTEPSERIFNLNKYVYQKRQSSGSDTGLQEP